MNAIDKDYLIDVASTLDNSGMEDEKLRDIIKDNYEYLAPYIDSLYYVEANIIYLNYVHNVPQVLIAEIFNMTQYGVSKRIMSALKRLSIYMSIPNQDTADNYNFLKRFLPNSRATAVAMFYSLKTVHTVSRVLRASNLTVTDVINETMDFMLELQAITEPIEFKKKIYDIKPDIEIDFKWLEALTEEDGLFLVTRHTINTHYLYLKSLKDYNSRGSHNFRKEWH